MKLFTKNVKKMEVLKTASHIIEYNYNYVKANKITNTKPMHRKIIQKKLTVITYWWLAVDNFIPLKFVFSKLCLIDHTNSFIMKIPHPWLVWLSGLSASL